MVFINNVIAHSALLFPFIAILFYFVLKLFYFMLLEFAFCFVLFVYYIVLFYVYVTFSSILCLKIAYSVLFCFINMLLCYFMYIHILF